MLIDVIRVCGIVLLVIGVVVVLVAGVMIVWGWF
ncbi:hypothetical protein LCGC14_1380110 [marine sediment metagenome]|uniref:Uncharacterized protein n=1 Tax=marine sediment metagenome TaxID=412755 RepID=A0A0F9MIB4_9ZZZZ